MFVEFFEAGWNAGLDRTLSEKFRAERMDGSDVSFLES